jgi:hypothetical protein
MGNAPRPRAVIFVPFRTGFGRLVRGLSAVAAVGLCLTVVTDGAAVAATTAPVVSKLSTTSGTTQGGTRVIIQGRGFTGAKTVLFGKVAGKRVKVLSSTKLSVTAPPHKAASLSVRVKAGKKTSPVTRKGMFTYVAPPRVSALSPNRLPVKGGTAVTLTGRNFVKVKAVRVGGTAAQAFRAVSSTSLRIRVPAHASGTFHVQVTTAYGKSTLVKADQVRYIAVPTVTSVSPDGGPAAGGQAVTITGTDFIDVTNVRFGTVSATDVKVVSTTELTAVVPTAAPGSFGQVGVTVTTPYGTSNVVTAAHYTYSIPPVTRLTAKPTAGGISLAWTVPAGVKSVIVRRDDGTVAPATHADGQSVGGTALAGTASGVVDASVSPGQTYAYSVFTTDANGVTSVPVSAKAIALKSTTGPGAIQQIDAATNVTADALPTVQIDGVAWTQLIVGNTVYVGGDFRNARPAGVLPGVSDTPRTDLLAYDITTGKLITSFNTILDGQVFALAASPDGRTIYAGGDFNTVNNKGGHAHLVALDATTGATVSGFAGSTNATVRTLALNGVTLYAGGTFGAANGNDRKRLAAFNSTTGALLGWAPTADDTVYSIVLTPDKSKVVIGGTYLQLNGANSYGIGAVDAMTGAGVQWLVNTKLRDYGRTQQGYSAVWNLAADGEAVYGTGINFGVHNSKSYEGVWSADPTDGSIIWLEDCHGDSYGAFPMNGTVYTVSHSHFCGDAGGFPDDFANPHRTMAWTAHATGVLKRYTLGGNYNDFGGTPAPSIIDWFPDLLNGKYTGQGQAAWTVTGNGTYLVEGGEFPGVNGGKQQGLVRFAIRSTTGNPGREGPRLKSVGTSSNPTIWTPTSVTATSATTARVIFPANWDRDDQRLTYTVKRDGVTCATGSELSAVSYSWSRPSLTANCAFSRANDHPGQNSHGWTVTATDQYGNTATSAVLTASV